MSATVVEIYKDGHIDLTEWPAGIVDGEVLITLDQTKGATKSEPLERGKYSTGPESTENDLKMAEWNGDESLDR